jgi:hypothetical protein
MKILRFTESVAGLDFSYNIGQVALVKDSLAKDFLRGKCAIQVEQDGEVEEATTNSLPGSEVSALVNTKSKRRYTKKTLAQ